MSQTANTDRQCQSCSGTGELGTDAGVVDCPDCGGAGLLPHPHTLVEWRIRDIERAQAAGREAVAGDVRWLVSELRRARAALTEIVALSSDAAVDGSSERIASDAGRADVYARIQMISVRALELYTISATGS
jgi:hypothetical protein